MGCSSSVDQSAAVAAASSSSSSPPHESAARPISAAGDAAAASVVPSPGKEEQRSDAHATATAAATAIADSPAAPSFGRSSSSSVSFTGVAAESPGVGSAAAVKRVNNMLSSAAAGSNRTPSSIMQTQSMVMQGVNVKKLVFDGGMEWYRGEVDGDDVPDGEGVFHFANGSTIEGQFRRGLAHGFCVYSYADSGDVFEGEYVDYREHGRGRYVWASDGSYYDGNWRDGERHGVGFHCMAGGASFLGEYVDGKKHGLGTYKFPGGAIYVGHFVDDAMHTPDDMPLGVYFFASGAKAKVRYASNVLIEKNPLATDAEAEAALAALGPLPQLDANNDDDGGAPDFGM